MAVDVEAELRARIVGLEATLAGITAWDKMRDDVRHLRRIEEL